MLFKQCSELYEDIARIIWNIMPSDSSKYIFECKFQPNYQGYRMYWIDNNGDEKNYSLGEFPEDKVKILNLYAQLKDIMSRLGSDWTQSRFILDKSGNFDVKFAYILEEDSWGSLYMRGISDLSWEEADDYNIPREIWEERIKAKTEKQDS